MDNVSSDALWLSFFGVEEIRLQGVPNAVMLSSPLGLMGVEELGLTGNQDEVWCSFMCSGAIWSTWSF